MRVFYQCYISEKLMSNLQNINLPIIGRVNNAMPDKFGLPRQPNLVDLPATIHINPNYANPQAFIGLTDYSHIWVLWLFHHNKPPFTDPTQHHFRPQVRPPRLGGNQKIGVFATRSPIRPAPIGLSVLKLHHIQTTTTQVSLHVSGADMVNGTPVLDIKPYVSYTDALPQAISGFAKQAPDKKTVSFEAKALQQAAMLGLNSQDITLIEQMIALDPRPAYQQDVTKHYHLRYKQTDINFKLTNAAVFRVITITQATN